MESVNFSTKNVLGIRLSPTLHLATEETESRQMFDTQASGGSATTRTQLFWFPVFFPLCYITCTHLFLHHLIWVHMPFCVSFLLTFLFMHISMDRSQVLVIFRSYVAFYHIGYGLLRIIILNCTKKGNKPTLMLCVNCSCFVGYV